METISKWLIQKHSKVKDSKVKIIMSMNLNHQNFGFPVT